MRFIPAAIVAVVLAGVLPRVPRHQLCARIPIRRRRPRRLGTVRPTVALTGVPSATELGWGNGRGRHAHLSRHDRRCGQGTRDLRGMKARDQGCDGECFATTADYRRQAESTSTRSAASSLGPALLRLLMATVARRPQLHSPIPRLRPANGSARRDAAGRSPTPAIAAVTAAPAANHHSQPTVPARILPVATTGEAASAAMPPATGCSPNTASGPASGVHSISRAGAKVVAAGVWVRWHPQLEVAPLPGLPSRPTRPRAESPSRESVTCRPR